MKKILQLIFGLLLLANLAVAQELYVANNNPGAASGTNVFTGGTALQDAIAAASTTAPYDIIYVVPSSVAYGQITIDRGITIFGIGIRPEKDLSSKSLVGPVYINSSDVRISGLTGPTNGGVFMGWSVSSVTYSNIIIENSYFREIRQTNDLTVMLDNLLIRNNIVFNDGWQGIELYTTSPGTALITNNVIYCERSTGSIKGDGLMIFNNLFVGDGSTTSRTVAEVDNSTFDHNIFYGSYVSLTSASTDNVWDDNLSYGGDDGSGTGETFSVGLYSNTSNSPNIEAQDPLFVSMPMSFNWTNAHDFTLQGGSPALNINGTDIGPSGGANPFISEGNILPLIQTVTVPATIPVGTDLPVTIKAKGN